MKCIPGLWNAIVMPFPVSTIRLLNIASFHSSCASSWFGTCSCSPSFLLLFRLFPLLLLLLLLLLCLLHQFFRPHLLFSSLPFLLSIQFIFQLKFPLNPYSFCSDFPTPLFPPSSLLIYLIPTSFSSSRSFSLLPPNLTPSSIPILILLDLDFQL